MSTSERIDELENQLMSAKRDYLKRFGWTETCNTPGAYWMWVRDFSDIDAVSEQWHADHPKASAYRPFGRIMAPTETAVSMTRNTLDTDELSP